MTRRKTHAEFVAEVRALVGGEYEVFGEYLNYRTKISIRHSYCGHKYEVSPDHFLRGTRCPNCYGTKRKTTAMFKKEVEILTSKEYEVLGDYINCKSKIKLLHSVCSKEYEVSPNSFLRGARCFECFGSAKKTTMSFKKEVKEMVGGEYRVFGEYVNNSTGIEIFHTECNNQYTVRPRDFLKGVRCPICAGVKKKTTSAFMKEVNEIEGNNYIVVGDYINNKTKISIKHSECGTEYDVTPKEFLRGNRCPTCNESKGERSVYDFLRRNGINHIREFKSPACRYKKELPFDFAIIQNNIVTSLIEYDGKQHFESIKHFGGEKTLRETQRRDAIKTQYCADNGIPLIRIPYWDFDNIETILTEKLLPLLKDADKHNAS